MPQRKKSIVVGGSLAQRPGNGGHTWVLLQYLLGFEKLGYDVVIITDACRGINVPEGSVDKALDDMKSAGAQFVVSKDFE